MLSYLQGFDISFHNGYETDFWRIQQHAKFLFIRAGQGKWIDSFYSHNCQEAQKVGLPVGSYWFYDNTVLPEVQAKLYIEQLSQHGFGELPMCPDFEDRKTGAYSGWKNWKVFVKTLQELAPEKQIMIYTGPGYWGEFTRDAPAQELEYFAQFPLWLAHYGVAVPTVPPPWEKWTFWQYTDTGNASYYGVGNGDKIDMNYYYHDSDHFKQEFSLEIAEPKDEYRRIAEGIVYHKIVRYGATCHIVIYEPDMTRTAVSNFGFKTVSQAAALLPDALVVTNCDGWGLRGVEAGKPNSLCWSNGIAIQTKQFESRPWASISEDGFVTFGWQKLRNPYTVFSGDRFVVQNGKFNTAITWRKERDARTVFGDTFSGLCILMVVDGWNYRQGYSPRGLTFPEIAEVLREFDCKTAINLDGGGSSAMALEGDVISSPNDDGVFSERAVVNHVAVYPLNSAIQPKKPKDEKKTALWKRLIKRFRKGH